MLTGGTEIARGDGVWYQGYEDSVVYSGNGCRDEEKMEKM
jgi:hypothetical protein